MFNISFWWQCHHYTVDQINDGSTSIMVQDIQNRKVFQVLIPKTYLGLNLYKELYNQYLWQVKTPQKLIQVDKDKNQIILHLKNIKKDFKFTCSVWDMPPTNQDKEIQEKIKKLISQHLQTNIYLFENRVSELLAQTQSRINQSAQNSINRIMIKEQEYEQKMQLFLTSQIYQTQLRFQKYLKQSQEFLTNNIRKSQAILSQGFLQLIDQQKLVMENLEKNIRQLKQNLEELQNTFDNCQKDFENKFQILQINNQNLSNQLRAKIDRNYLFELFQQMRLLKLLPSHLAQRQKDQIIQSENILRSHGNVYQIEEQQAVTFKSDSCILTWINQKINQNQETEIINNHFPNQYHEDVNINVFGINSD